MRKISVLLPVYNTNTVHLREAIDSVLNQTFNDFELLIYNDASTQQSVEDVVLSYSDPRIRYFKGVKNLGIARTRNLLIDEAHGEYLAVMDHDDRCLPIRFEKQIAWMESHPDVAICGTGHKRFGRLFKSDTIIYPSEDEEIRTALFFKNVIHHPSTMMRRSVLMKYNLRYDTRFISVNDRKLYTEIAKHGQLANLPEVLCLYRLHANMTSKKKRQLISNEQAVLRNDFLQQMGATLTNSQLEILNSRIMNGRARIRNFKTLEDIKNVLDILISANDSSGYLPKGLFRKECAKYLLKRCTNAAIFGGISSKSILKDINLKQMDLRQPLLLRLVNMRGEKK